MASGLPAKAYIRTDLEESKRLNLALLGTFFLQPYDAGHDFYEQFQARRKSFCDVGAEHP